MIMKQTPDIRLIDRLPEVRGRYTADAPLNGVTWFRVGGTAEIMFRPADRDDLISFLSNKPSDVPVTVFGVGSNLLVRDGGIPGVVLRLGRGFADIEAEGHDIISGAAALDLNVATAAKLANIGGLEFLCGIPGTIGGALRMNAGAYERETKDVLVWAEAIDQQGKIHRLQPEDMGFAYRKSSVPADWIFLGARLHGHAGDPAAIASQMSKIQASRSESQPIRTRTGGSTFKNPPGEKAWQLIDRAGCRGLKRGGAMVSELHCNFLINTGSATAEDIEQLGEEVRAKVLADSGVTLEWEIRRIGARPSPDSQGGAV
ncbi:UDP-N-acetylmuramate dehydrogenase [Pelagibius sp. Alg239-R121]|uniref:UDP-N-acetylmuramate dehydrogenase n=1 Tax=Pelagibius sp. Alg239-R121 TaxID=2993448 RepID=UPI00345F71AD